MMFFVDVTDEINNAANASAISGLTTRVTAAEGKISTNSQSITQLKGDVSTLQGQIANKADASALQQLQTTVIQQGDKLASQGSAITELQNTAQNGKAKYWLTKIFDIKVSGSGYIPKLSDLSGVPPLAVSEMADAAKLDFQSYGDYKIAYAKSLVYLNADKTIEIAPGSRIVDDTGRLYVNSVETASLGASTTKYSLALKGLEHHRVRRGSDDRRLLHQLRPQAVRQRRSIVQWCRSDGCGVRCAGYFLPGRTDRREGRREQQRNPDPQ